MNPIIGPGFLNQVLTLAGIMMLLTSFNPVKGTSD